MTVCSFQVISQDLLLMTGKRFFPVGSGWHEASFRSSQGKGTVQLCSKRQIAQVKSWKKIQFFFLFQNVEKQRILPESDAQQLTLYFIGIVKLRISSTNKKGNKRLNGQSALLRNWLFRFYLVTLSKCTWVFGAFSVCRGRGTWYSPLLYLKMMRG